ncbi:MAG: N-acetylmuramoyl-L-alanine amidase [Candidatus Omnitrophica bacterium]|nr:N-acetylmuramoyl-L-alanine amidase [Candidatus Omnitrophota bacterium]
MKRLIIFICSITICLHMASVSFGYVINGSQEKVDTPVVKIDGKSYVLLVDLCKAYGLEWVWDSVSRRILLKKNGISIDFLSGSKYYYAGGNVKTLRYPLEIENGNLYIPLYFAKGDIERLFKIKKSRSAPPVKREAIREEKKDNVSPSSKKRYGIKRVVLDPGHGGRDPGAIGRTGLYEKHVALDVSKRIKKELERKGLEVILTRDTDKFVTLQGRTDIANKADANLFVSIHANANKKRWVKGFEVYYLSEATDDCARALAASENSVLEYEDESFGRHTKELDAIVWDLRLTENREESIELAGYICREVSEKVDIDSNSVKCARFYVLKGAEMPAVLVELSYLSNAREEKNLKSDSYKQKLAEGIAQGIMDYKDEYERTNGFSL